MIEISDLTVYTKVVELESLTKAGEALAIPKSTVSRKITRLEHELGTKLLHRTTHSVTVTEQGQIFFDYCLRCLGVLRDGQRAVQRSQKTPQGLLRIAVPAELDRSLLAPLLTDYLRDFPDVRLVSVLVNEQFDILRGGFDLAIIVGELPHAESSLIATKLGHTGYGLYASPHYLERSGAPQNQIDLPRFDLLAWGSVDARAHWRLHFESDEVTVEFTPRLTCNDLMLLRQAALSGLGIAALPAFICKRDLAEGSLVEVLPGWEMAGTDFYAVFPRDETVPARLRAFIDYLVERLRPALSWQVG